MLDLSDVTLIALTNRDFEGHKKAMEISSQGIHWGAKKIIWDDTIKDINDWNYKMVYELHHYIQTDYAMVIHADGYVIHPEVWRDSWRYYDYIGAPWPLPRQGDTVSYRVPETGELVRVGNSVSLRSKRLLRLPSHLGLEWKPYHGFWNEDGFLACNNRPILESHGIRYAPLSEAVYFSKEHSIPENEGIETFAFHTVDQ